MALLLALLLALIFAAARAGGLGGAYYEARGAWLPLAAGSTQPLPVADRKRGAAGAEEEAGREIQLSAINLNIQFHKLQKAMKI